jgi:hypothetical protein
MEPIPRTTKSIVSELEGGFSPNPGLYQDLEAGPAYDDPILSANTTNPTAQLVFTLDR